MTRTQIQLDVDDLPRNWCNVLADLPKIPEWKVEDEKQWENYKRILTKEHVKQEFSKNRWIRIPDELREYLIHIGRPYPLYRAEKLEQYLKTPARIYYKREDLSPTGAFKTTVAIPSCYYGMKEGYGRIAVATGAGQTGTAFAYAAKMFGQKCTIYWLKYAHDMKPERRSLTKLYGAEVLASPTDRTEVGRGALKELEAQPQKGTVSVHWAEALEDTLSHEDTFSPTGTAYRHCILYTSLIGLETKKQLEQVEEKPDVIISCVGGGSNFGGIIAPFVRDVLDKKLECRFLGVESEGAPRLTRGEYRYEYYDTLKTVPMVKTYTLGLEYPRPHIWGSGLGLWTTSEILGYLKHNGIVEAVAYPSDERLIFEGLKAFVQTEGFVPAPESGYAIRASIDEALRAKEEEKEKVIVMNISGHGLLDLGGYSKMLGLS